MIGTLGALVGVFLYDLIVGYGFERWRRSLLAGLMIGFAWSVTDFGILGDILVGLPALMLADVAVKQARADRT